MCVALYLNKSLGFRPGNGRKKNANFLAHLDPLLVHLPSKYSCGRSSSAFRCPRGGFTTYFCSFLSASRAASPSFCPSPRCCLAGGHWGQIIILKLKWAVWTQNWGMNCLIELAAVAAFPAARTELFALSSSHPHLGA